MATIAPLYELVLFLRMRLEQGESVRTALKSYLEGPPGPLSTEIMQLLTQGRVLTAVSAQRQVTWALLSRGLAGEPILATLAVLEIEIQENCQHQIQNFVAALPIKLLIPLLLFQFPAFLLLLLGPIVMNLIDSLNN